MFVFVLATDIEQMGAYNGCMERVSVSISKRCRKQRIGQKKEIGERLEKNGKKVRSNIQMSG